MLYGSPVFTSDMLSWFPLFGQRINQQLWESHGKPLAIDQAAKQDGTRVWKTALVLECTKFESSEKASYFLCKGVKGD